MKNQIALSALPPRNDEKCANRILPLFLFLIFVFLILTGAAIAPAEESVPPQPPKLVIIAVIDGLPYYQFTELGTKIPTHGIADLLSHGANFTQARYGYALTLTAPGHATLLTGVYPSKHGVIGNGWRDPKTLGSVYATEDARYACLGESTKHRDGSVSGTSPLQLQAETLGDALIRQTGGKAQVLSLSVKDRAAILSGGKKGLAYFYSRDTERFITSDYYLKKYPDWWNAYYQKEELSARGKKDPHSDLRLLDFAFEAVKNYGLGKNPSGAPDFLILSFSEHDGINHRAGPQSELSQSHLQVIDQAITELLRYLQDWIGLENTLLVLTADHGFARDPDSPQARKKSAIRVDGAKITAALNQKLAETFKRASIRPWAKALMPMIYLDPELLAANPSEGHAILKTAQDFLSAQPGIENVYTRTDLLSGRTLTPREQLVHRSMNPERSGDLYLVPKTGSILLDFPGQFYSHHGTPYGYDRHVPLILSGKGIQPGRYDFKADLADVAPTVAKILNVSFENADGRVLSEALKK